MTGQQAVRSGTCGLAKVAVFASQQALAEAAADKAAALIQAAIQRCGSARIIAATGNSQVEFITALTANPQIPWDRVEVFHMDEYAGMPDHHPASFRRWIKQRIEDKAPGARIYYIEADAPDLPAELLRYAALLAEKPIDVAFVGFGENGHIAFNDPPTADFKDRLDLKVVELDDACRRQQTGEGHFPTLDDVPKQAFTITCPALFRARAWVSVVPEKRKAKAVKAALEWPISTDCPASIVRTHLDATVFLDEDSASLLEDFAGVLEELIQREPIFHRREWGTTRADFEKMTAADFWEVGASGRLYTRDTVLDILQERYSHPGEDVWETSDFRCHKLADDVYLLTYELLQNGQRKTRRSTIWQRTPSGWQIVYHQGTIVQDA